MNVIKYVTPLMSLCLVACQTTDRPDPQTAKAALNESRQQAAAGQTIMPPPAAMPEDVQRELMAIIHWAKRQEPFPLSVVLTYQQTKLMPEYFSPA